MTIKVVYIASFSRSGSTILDAILGNMNNAVGIGELMRLSTTGWQNNEFCACGEKCLSCGFWNDVHERWVKSTGASAADYAALQDRFERFRRLPLLLKERKQPSAVFKEYERLSIALFKAIQEASGKDVIIDSSKAPFRALALGMTGAVDLRLIHLIRRRKDVMNSMAKPYKKDPAKGIEQNMPGESRMKNFFLWQVVNAQISWVTRQLGHDKTIKIRYEDFVATPEKELERIGHAINCDTEDIKERVMQNKSFANGHKIAGNRLRMNKEVSLLRTSTEA